MIQVIASLTVDPEGQDALNRYFQVAMPLIEEVGAKVVQKIEMGEPVIGEQPSKILMLVEYPDREAVMQVFESPQYQSIIPARQKAFSHYHVSFVSTNELIDSDE